ncbi:MAG: cysteine--tRNA ligase, partial [Bacteroidia bacterium]|nr:cysteine--tRNA ligase [Bacteroidia bacterium]
TVNGQKMSKSLGNSFLPHELFTGDHKLLEKGYSPMTVKFFMLQAHYRSTLDFSNVALQAAEKGLSRLLISLETLKKIKPSETDTVDVKKIQQDCYDAMNDDFNTPVVIASLFEAVKTINLLESGNATITIESLTLLDHFMRSFIFDILGLKEEKEAQDDKLENLMQVILNMRTAAKENKNFALSDEIRDKLKLAGFEIKDGKEGVSWTFN